MGRGASKVPGVPPGVHVVIFPFPAAGHIAPFIPFAKSLASSGVAITFMSSQLALSSLKQSLTDDETFAACRNINLVSFEIPDVGEMNQKKFDAIKMFLYAETRNIFDEIVGSLMVAPQTLVHYPVQCDAGPPVCIISDMFIGFTQNTAERFKIARYCLFASPGHFLSLFYHLPKFNSEGIIPIKMEDNPVVLPNFPLVPPHDLPPSQQAGPDPERHLFLLNEAKALWRSDGVLLNSVYELETSVLEGLHEFLRESLPHKKVPTVLTVGPLMERFGEGETSFREIIHAAHHTGDCFDWLGQQPDSSVLFICFGSVAQLPDAQIQEIAIGLENSGHRFFWVLRMPKDENGQPKKNLSDILPEGFIERTKSRGFVYLNWAPQLHILAHRAVGGFVTHCGWNSLLESLSLGIPMIAWPFQAEQMMNSILVDKLLGVAIRINKGGGCSELIGSDILEKAIHLLMSEQAGDAIKRKVLEVSDMIGRAARPGGSSRENLTQFVDYLHSLKGRVSMSEHQILKA